ncbi:DUF2239 domain-containing protein [Deinococcus irradiatisoli]|uniref:DUF2239 domain-containing protein n=1 Tax=Deinococcus irradiatisoli TaxID=2202254 RepID=A0A2Z3JF47_9DEIO|nr:DUF2239 family protein [Deinococcus irradiatisoli]AWN22020.1 DUF2239 domain-containing protein [Deinococcus irradiatisoli]
MSTYTAFLGQARLITAPLPELLGEVKRHLDAAGEALPLLIFDDRSGEPVDFNFQGSLAQVLARHLPPDPAPLGKAPEGREVRLLPRQWAWLDAQPGGASAALRRMVDEQRKTGAGRERARLATEATSRFLTTLAGELDGLEDVQRALYAKDRARFEALLFASSWPEGISAHALYLAQPAFGED